MVLRNSALSGTRKDINPERNERVPTWAHPVFKYYFDEWRLIRDCVEGEREIKEQATSYLPRLDNQTSKEYQSYLDRGTFYNFTGRTLGALVGTLFRRKPKISGVPGSMESRLKAFSKAGSNFEMFAETAAEEFMAVGRFGVLVELPAVPSASPSPYVVPYVAENIIDWDYEITDPVTGQTKLSYLVLREWYRGKDENLHKFRWFARYRKLVLERSVPATETTPASGPYRYVQYLYEAVNADADLQMEPKRSMPMIRGEALDYIPFHIFEMPKPPLLDIARLNVSHYRTYAHLEHGRYYTGLPVYVATTPQGSKGAYYIGPSVVWEMPVGGDAKILEYSGHGLNSLEKALANKEAHAAALGGRIIGVTPQSTAETDNQTAQKDRNEQVLLHRVSRLMDWGFEVILGWYADFANEDGEDIRVRFCKDFMYDALGAREFRAIQSMYKDGVLPIEVVYDYLVKAGVIDDEIALEDLKEMLESEDSFPNNPDFIARQEGYQNAQSKTSAELKEEELEIEEMKVTGELEDADDDREVEEDAREEERKSAEKMAKAAPPAGARPADPGVAAQRGAIRQQPAGKPPPPPRGPAKPKA